MQEQSACSSGSSVVHAFACRECVPDRRWPVRDCHVLVIVVGRGGCVGR